MHGAGTLDENNLQRITNRAPRHQQITTIEIGDSLARNREVEESCQRGRSADPCPSADAPPPKDRSQYRNQNHAESGDEGVFGRGRYADPRGAKGVVAKDENPEPHADP